MKFIYTENKAYQKCDAILRVDYNTKNGEINKRKPYVIESIISPDSDLKKHAGFKTQLKTRATLDEAMKLWLKTYGNIRAIEFGNVIYSNELNGEDKEIVREYFRTITGYGKDSSKRDVAVKPGDEG